LLCGGRTASKEPRSLCVAAQTRRFVPRTFGFAPAFELSRFAISSHFQYQA
jgi:hypothetical protein